MHMRLQGRMKYDSIRLDHGVILGLVSAQSSVLDLGCGSGDLLYILVKEKNVRGYGIEIDEQAIYNCVAKGLNVFHGDIDSGLSDYQDKSFDYVILNQSIQQVKYPQRVLQDASRVGRKVIVGFPNFAHYRARIQLFFNGIAPVTKSLPYAWYETPNIRCLSIYDFINFCHGNNFTIERRIYLAEAKRIYIFPNLFASSAIFLVSK